MDLEQKLADAQRLVGAAAESAEAFQKKSESSDRSRISGIIICTFAILLLGVFLYLAVSTIFQFQWNITDPAQTLGSKDAAALMKDILSSVVLPVVTLVLGFYFGTEKKN